MSCDTARALLSAYADDELAPRLTADVSAHLATCAACRDDLASLRRMGQLVRQALGGATTPDMLRARVRSALRDAHADESRHVAPAPGPRRRRMGWPLAVAAGLAIALASSSITIAVLEAPRGPSGALVAHDVVQRHIRSLMSGRTIEVASSDQHTVKPWFNGRVDFSPTVPRIDSLGFPLLGGRVDSIGSQAVAALVYGRRKHLINVFTWPALASAPARRDSMITTERGYHAMHWTGDGMEFWAVSDVAIGDLRAFADAFARDLGPATEGDSAGVQ